MAPISTAAIATQLTSGALSGKWVLDPTASKVSLATKAMWGVVPVKGTFGTIAGTAEVTPEGAVNAVIEVASGSINTKMKKRDEHLRSKDFFDSDQFPNITVTIESVAQVAESLTATGSLIVKTATLPLTFPITVTEVADGNVELDAEFTVDRSKVGVDYRARGAVKMDNTLSVHAVFRRA